ncbi:MAG: N-acetylmuramic acid 6-phosphate etherase [Candidatus Fervidibacter sp.]|uniref:N-acetylmuramic acid 6-phosphate etherase n=1 Tax=Candidatus Fervidibacter sp. TaxID=3100871 RepID=UPI004049E4C5
MSIVIGVDGGATKTVAAVATEDGTVLSVGTSGGSNPLVWGEAAFDNIRSACEAALTIAQVDWEAVSFVFVGMAGVDEPNSPSHRFAQSQLKSKLPAPFALDNDGFIAHAGALLGNDGVVVVAGTGAIAIGIAEGKRVRADGMGHWFGDEGSATWIALQGLNAAVRSQDGRGEQTKLAEVLLRELMLGSLRDAATLLATGDLTKFDLALLAVSVAKVAEKGDAVAQNILRDAAERLAESAVAVARRLGRMDLPIGFTGGVFRLTFDMPRLFREAILKRLPDAQICEPRLPPHLGATILAAKHLGWKIDKNWLDKLTETGKQWGYFDLGAGLVEVLPRLLSEQRNPASMFIDQLEVEAILTIINDEDHKVAPAVRQEIPAIAQAVRWAMRGLSRGGRLIYVGAGTSGRLGIMDAAECPPTFGTPPEWVIGVIAGGPQAVFRAVEGAEDNMDAGREEMKKLNVGENDVIVGLSVSGRTPFVIAAMDEAQKRGAKTVAITVNRDAPIAAVADVVIAPVVGPEIIAGSTRMKAGTAQKLILNMITTTTMVKLGRVKSNLMVDLRTWSVKLCERAKRIVAQLTGANLDEAEEALQQSNWEVRKAISLLQSKNRERGVG